MMPRYADGGTDVVVVYDEDSPREAEIPPSENPPVVDRRNPPGFWSRGVLDDTSLAVIVGLLMGMDVVEGAFGNPPGEDV